MSDQATSAQQKTVASVPNTAHEGVLQRKCACGQHTVAGGECEACRKKHGGMMQRAAVNTAPVTDVPPVVNEVLSSAGQPLDAGTAEFMGQGFGYDFSAVRIYTDAKAAESAQAVNALAYTVGSSMVFDSGRYAPTTSQGRRLLAHELTHVVQQGSGPLANVSPQSVNAPSDSLEQAADQIAEQVVEGQSDTAHGLQVSPNGGVSMSGQLYRSPAPKAQAAKATPTFEEAAMVLKAIVDIINEQVEIGSEGLVHPKMRPENHPDVPAQYQPLLREWFLITHGSVNMGFATVVYSGTILQTHMQKALTQTDPLIKTLLAQGDAPTKSWLNVNFFAKVNSFKARARSEEVSEAIEKAAATAISKQSSISDAGSEEEKQKRSVTDALTTVRLALTVTTRYTNSMAVLDVKRLNEQFKTALDSVPTNQVTEKAKIVTLPVALMYLKSGLDGLNAILTVTDKEKQATLLKEHEDIFGKAAAGVEISKLVVQFVNGTAAVLGAGYSALATVLGKVQQAAQILGKVTPVLNNINLVLNVLGLLHGSLVLLDSEATPEAKVNAVLEVGLGGIGVLGRFIAGFSVPATFSVVINFYVFKTILEEVAKGEASLIRLGLNICYNDMQKNARYINSTALKMSIGLQMMENEKDPSRKTEIAKQVDGLRWNLRDFFLKPYIERATKEFGAGNADPGAYGPLRTRFLPLLGQPMDTDLQLLGVALQLVQIVQGCVKDAQTIFDETVKWSWQRHASLGTETEGDTRLAGSSTVDDDTRGTRTPTAVQTKLAVSEPGDMYEQEADHVAEMVTQTSNMSGKPLHKRVTDARGMLQAKEVNGQASPVAIQDGGQPLSDANRTFFESHFGYDFSQIRVHTNARSADSAQAVNALAYTVGRDIVFGPGQYAPETNTGRRLLAHELTHTIQQRSLWDSPQQHFVQRTQQVQVGKGATSITLVVGGLRFSKDALDDVMKGGALLPGPDQAHIGFHGDLLGYDLNYTQPADPFRWSKIKEIIDSDQKVLVQKTSLFGSIKVLFITPKGRQIISDNLKSLGLTLPTEALYKSIYPSDMFLSVSPSADTHSIYYTTALGTAADSSLAHELLGHLWLALKGVPFVHPNEQKDPDAVIKKGTLRPEHGVKDPFGNPYIGTVLNYINRYIGSEGQALKSPTQNVGPQLLRQAITAFKADFVTKSSGILNGRWSVPNDVALQWEIVSKNFALAPANASQLTTPTTSQGTTGTSTPQVAPPSSGLAAPTPQSTPSGTPQGAASSPTSQVTPQQVASGPAGSPASQAVPTVTQQGIQQELTTWYAILNPNQQYVFIKFLEDLLPHIDRETGLAFQLDKTLKRPIGMSSSSATP